jgi:hypothetical protein
MHSLIPGLLQHPAYLRGREEPLAEFPLRYLGEQLVDHDGRPAERPLVWPGLSSLLVCLAEAGAHLPDLPGQPEPFGQNRACRRLTRHRRQAPDNYAISSGRCLAVAKRVLVPSPR